MKKRIIDDFACPECDGNVVLLSSMSAGSKGEIKEGILGCSKCKSEFSIKDYIPRFVPSENYAASFGFQWNKHAATQIDKFSGIQMSRNRFFNVTGWPATLKGEKILEAGCGAGRFTQIAAATGAEIHSFDYSSAIDANMRNNAEHENIHFIQADIFRMPFQKNSFDRVYCFGMLQHCPDPRKAFMSLIPFLKPGGEVVIDVYCLTIRAFVNPKYWLRPFTKRMSSEKLYNLCTRAVPKLFPIKMWITENIPFGKYFAFFIPVAYHKGFIPEADHLSYEKLVEWSILDTFDKFSPQYDKPQRINTVRRWFEEAGLKNISVCYGPNGINGKGVKT